MTRDAMIDYIEDNYNTDVNFEKLYQVMEDMFGRVDDTGDEGIYTDLSDSDLSDLIDEMDSIFKSNYNPIISIQLTAKELQVLKKAMEDYSDPAFTKDFDMSRIARNILRKL